jgi:hypothetical protein
MMDELSQPCKWRSATGRWGIRWAAWVRTQWVIPYRNYTGLPVQLGPAAMLLRAGASVAITRDRSNRQLLGWTQRMRPLRGTSGPAGTDCLAAM